MKRTAVALLAVAAAMFALGCGSSDHSWRGEIDAQIEEAEDAIEEAAPKFGRTASDVSVGEAGLELGKALEPKIERIAQLEPPHGCEKVQDEGQSQLYKFGLDTDRIYEEMNAYLRRKLPSNLKEEVAELRAFRREAETCE